MFSPLAKSEHDRKTGSVLKDSYMSPAKPWEQGKGGMREGLKRAAWGFPERADRPLADSSSTTAVHGSDNEESVELSHAYWCPTCENDKIMGTRDGWKRHMREHKVAYACNICTGKDLGNDLAYNRRLNLVRHLSEHHGFPYDAADILSKKWRYAEATKAYACGFCIQTFEIQLD